jgi:transposase-like protein
VIGLDEEFRKRAARSETGKPIALVARKLDVDEGTLGNRRARARHEAGEGGGELAATSGPNRRGCWVEIVE